MNQGMLFISIILKFLGYALLTFVLELPAALIGFGRKKMVVLYCFLINMITNLITNLMIFILSGYVGGYWVWVIIFEILVLVSESILWKWGASSFLVNEKVSWKKCVSICVISNLISFAAGLFIM